MAEDDPELPDPHVWWAGLLVSRAKRYLRLLELKSPALVLENERRLINDAFMRLPVAPESIRLADESLQKHHDDIRQEIRLLKAQVEGLTKD